MKIEKLDWDSEFFQRKVGKCEFNQVEHWDAEVMEQWDLVYLFVTPQSVGNSFLEQKGLQLMDRKRTYVAPLQGIPFQDHDRVRSYTAGALDEDVIKIGVESGVYSRFKVDPRFSHQQFEDLYRIWMRRSIHREIARGVLVYEEDNKIFGVITLGEKDRRADIGILSVDSKQKGKGIGRSLVESTMRMAGEMGYKEIQVVAQGANTAACTFYENCGFLLDSEVNIYHYWKNNDPL